MKKVSIMPGPYIQGNKTKQNINSNFPKTYNMDKLFLKTEIQ